ncbi:hypothetical protein VH22019_00066 [Vibrio phage VH2_2019]|nr:hypothetical protein VH22019_00066 [Vibrio phage VH2_2019]
MTGRYTRAKRRKDAIATIVKDYAGEALEVCFVGAYAMPTQKAPVCKYVGTVGLLGDLMTIHTVDAAEGLNGRHTSKIVSIRLASSGLTLFGQYCKKCQIGVPAKFGNCQSCCSKLYVGSIYH